MKAATSMLGFARHRMAQPDQARDADHLGLSEELLAGERRSALNVVLARGFGSPVGTVKSRS
jgi:hypothetical protein